METEKLAEIRERIVAGETTGNPIVDLVVVRANKLDQETVDLYYDLAARVAAHVGEPALVVRQKEKRTSFSGPQSRRKESGTLHTHLGLGILNDESLVLDIPRGRWAFPTERYAHKFEEDVHLVDQNLATNLSEGVPDLAAVVYEGYLNQPIKLQYEHFAAGDVPPALEVYVGDAEINGWLEQDYEPGPFSAQRNGRAYNKLAELLDLPQTVIHSNKAFDQEIERRLNV